MTVGDTEDVPLCGAIAPPVLSEATLRRIAHDVLDIASADIVSVLIDHTAIGATRVSENRVRLTNSGDTLVITIRTQFGQRGNATLYVNQIDTASLQDAVRRAEAIAHEQLGDPAPTPDAMSIPLRHYVPNTTWHEGTADAMAELRQTVVPTLLQPMLAADLRAAAYVGVAAHAMLFADRRGMFAVGQETDAEMTVTGWSRTDRGTLGSPGWAGQAAREWRTLDPTRVGTEAARFTQLAANAVAYEPGRRLTILDRPAVAQMVRAMGADYDAQATHMGLTPLTGIKIGARVVDPRVTVSSDPNDPDGGYLPFDTEGYPQIAMPWLVNGALANLAYSPVYAVGFGMSPANDAPDSVRLQSTQGPRLSVAEMIANAEQAIYVNRVSDINVLNTRSGLMTGVTSGGTFLVRNGKIDKSVKDFRFVDSLYFMLNNLVAIGTAERTAMGYAPWYGSWPIAPTIVPPLMVRDFNFIALAEAI